MSLPQDQAQSSEASNIIAERKYQQDLITYNEEKKTYDAEVKSLEEAKAKEQAKVDAEAKAQADKAIAIAKERADRL